MFFSGVAARFVIVASVCLYTMFLLSQYRINLYNNYLNA